MSKPHLIQAARREPSGAVSVTPFLVLARDLLAALDAVKGDQQGAGADEYYGLATPGDLVVAPGTLQVRTETAEAWAAWRSTVAAAKAGFWVRLY